MAKQEFKVPINPDELNLLVSPLSESGATAEELEEILNLELEGERRRYVVNRLASRICKLRNAEFIKQVTRRMGE